MGSPRRSRSSNLPLKYLAGNEEESSTISAGKGATSPKVKGLIKRYSGTPIPQEAMASPSVYSSSTTAGSPAPKTALHDQLHVSVQDEDFDTRITTPTRLFRKPSLLSRLSSTISDNGTTPSRRKQRKELKKLKKQQRRRDERRRKSDSQYYATTGSVSNEKPTRALNGNQVVCSPTASVQTSNSTSRRSRSSILFLKRVLSSPPILRQRLRSSSHLYGNKFKERDTSDGSCCQDNSNNDNISSSSRSSVELNPKTNNDTEMPERISIVAKSVSPTASKNRRRRTELEEESVGKPADAMIRSVSCNATSIFHHSFSMESICGVSMGELHNSDMSNLVFEESNRKLMGATNYGSESRQGNLMNDTLGQQSNLDYSYCDSMGPISEDPTVQESIECIFASQLEDGLNLWDDEHDGSDENCTTEIILQRHNPSFGTLNRPQNPSSSSSPRGNLNELVSPAGFQQSRMNRKDRKNSSRSLYANMSQNKRRYEQASLVYVGTFDPSCPSPTHTISQDNVRNISTNDNSLDSATIYDTINPLPCRCATNFLPAIEPKDWPQAPIALRPTPGSGTKVKAIRLCNSDEPLWVPGSHLTWSQSLAKRWGRKYEDQSPHFASCEECVMLPINNGNEAPGESLVTDFESELFEGTLLLRLRHSDGTTPEPYDDSKGYFAGVNRRYQVCIRGRFKKTLSFTELNNGFRLRRKFGKLPSKWVLKSALKVVSFFAPQLDIKLEGVDQPYSLTPLGSTPQCITIDDADVLYNEKNKEMSGCSGLSDGLNSINKNNPLDGTNEEPIEAHRSLIGAALKADTSLQRAKMRKKAFDKLFVQKSPCPKTDPSKIYTFEFLQHMLNFQDFTVELGSVMGSLELGDILDGQPLQVMAEHGPSKIRLWSFDVWNECLWNRAKEHDKAVAIAASK